MIKRDLSTKFLSSFGQIVLVILMAAAITLNTSCSKDDEEPIDMEGVTVIDVTNHFVEWIYVSFNNDDLEIVNVDDFANDHSWDLGIRYQNFRTNGGESGSAIGGVYDLGLVDFNNVTIGSIAGKDLVEDDSITVLESHAMPPSWISVPGSVPLEEMFETPTGPNRTYAPNNHVYVLKTAEGRHVKMHGVTFFNEHGVEGHINLKWEFLD